MKGAGDGLIRCPPCDAWHGSFHLGRNSVRPTFHLLRISHIRNSVRPTFHLLRISHIRNSVWPTFHLLLIFHSRHLPPDGRGGRFNFPGQTCLDPLVALTGRTFAADNSDSLDSLARQTLAIRRIHFRLQ
uniref:Uncharacterized protein n=1 Tax=Vitis vinifera TaxID=29760 RepID=A5AJ52_VITVI|nr:hypothetical protein VITISV_011783 [Vitis vinifera]